MRCMLLLECSWNWQVAFNVPFLGLDVGCSSCFIVKEWRLTDQCTEVLVVNFMVTWHLFSVYCIFIVAHVDLI